MGRKNSKTNRNTKADKSLDRLKEDIISFLDSHPSRRYTHKQISGKLNIAQKHLKNNIESILETMARKGKIKSVDYKYSSRMKEALITGVVDYVSPRHAFIVSDEIEKDIYVKVSDLKNALDDDLVTVRL